MYYRVINTQIGALGLAASANALTGVEFSPSHPSVGSSELLETAEKQIQEYLAGERKQFSLPLEYDGTPFQVQIWQQLLQIPWGETKTYGEIARRIGNPRAGRAVGGACNANPLALIIPCHRVVGVGGLTGFGGGLDVKRYLLELEQK